MFRHRVKAIAIVDETNLTLETAIQLGSNTLPDRYAAVAAAAIAWEKTFAGCGLKISNIGVEIEDLN